ncbi:MAG: NADH-quinone oxidoreductase subunit C [Bacteroidota bacterium]|nr:NADH-quinone oxidoreductase subunit C [Bacteroidota bacterium]MDP4218233.1 NADH-quinone oxidoreductase subunit C [Bacteroidota bacterium]MDP4259398.1 NADH-quinone oxidoreductase subunit C [Bacteroidota bacterium]
MSETQPKEHSGEASGIGNQDPALQRGKARWTAGEQQGLLNNQTIKERLIAKFGDQVAHFEEPYGMLTFEAPRELNLKILQFLFDDEQLRFQFLTDLCAVHYPGQAGRELAVVYHLHNLVDNVRLRFKIYAPIAQPDVFTVTALYESANWMERETFDFFGVNFVGHPNLKRILNVDEMEYFPMRKEFPMEDQTRIDKDDAMFGRGGPRNEEGIQ